MKVERKRLVLPRESEPARHSPGPWALEYDGSVVIGGQIAISPDSCGPDDVGREVRKANCRLIAAAPDLLQMLRDVDAHFAAHFGEQAWATSEIGGMTRVSIAKATGGVA